MKILLSESEELVLKRSLPGCPKGRTLEKMRGGGFYIVATDKEIISGAIKTYQFTDNEINKNPQWFEKIK